MHSSSPMYFIRMILISSSVTASVKWLGDAALHIKFSIFKGVEGAAEPRDALAHIREHGASTS